MDSFFTKGSFKGSKCKTLLKLTIPRIKLLRNRRELQIKQMRRDIAKLLETGQEATARIRVEHIIREEKMMAAQEIIELFCELVVVRLPIIEAQRECPLDLKEAISSLCFAAPRCADLPELIQVQMSFAAKYGKEFVAAATELRPECSVNRQLIEQLSVRAPAPDVKLKLLKEIAEEHELDWDPTASETELLKPHEDLLNGPSQFLSGSTLPVPQEKHDESSHTVSEQAHDKQSDSDEDFDMVDFPEVPNSSIQPTPTAAVSRPEMLPFPSSALSDLNEESEERSGNKSPPSKSEDLNASLSINQERQFLPFISPPSASSPTFAAKESSPSPAPAVPPVAVKESSPSPAPAVPPFAVKESSPPPAPAVPRTRNDANVDLQDVLAAAHAAADSAERAAAAARTAASLAQLRISELTKKQNEEEPSGEISENPFSGNAHQSHVPEKQNVVYQASSKDHDGVFDSSSPPQPATPPGGFTANHPPQRLPSMDDESFLSYPNLFTSRSPPGDLSPTQSFTDNPRSSGGH